MKATVVIATYRPFGAVVPLRALQRQRFLDFDVIVVTEIGAEAWGNRAELVKNVQVVEAPSPKYHSPTHALNLGLEHVKRPIVALLADFAYPHEDWLGALIETLERTPAPFVGGVKCGHGTADWNSCVPSGGAGACGDRSMLPLGLVDGMQKVPCDIALVHPFRGAFNLGNAAFSRADALAVNGFDERFSGDHGSEDENFVRRLVASTQQQAVVTRKAVVHHYWPYANGYKPLLRAEARHWARAPNGLLDRVITEGEVLVGKLKAQRVPIIDASSEMLVERVPSAPYVDVEGAS